MFLRSSIPWATLATFLAHVVWGCCAHSFYASERSCNDGVVDVRAAVSEGFTKEHSKCSHGMTREHQSLCDENPCERHERPPLDCGCWRCSFAVSSKVKSPVSSVSAIIVTVAIPVNTSVLFSQPTQTAPDYPLGARSARRAGQLLQTWLL